LAPRSHHHDHTHFIGQTPTSARTAAAWLGHRHPASTYYYLQAAPELLALAAERLPDLGARS
jgi:integrase